MEIIDLKLKSKEKKKDETCLTSYIYHHEWKFSLVESATSFINAKMKRKFLLRKSELHCRERKKVKKTFNDIKSVKNSNENKTKKREGKVLLHIHRQFT